MSRLNILLLTYKDADNLGDPIIATCAAALLHVALTELGIEDFDIDSRNLYFTDDGHIAKADLIIFGGGGVIKYKYQDFPQRISYFIKIAERHRIPVLFSAVGVEGYDDTDERCLMLKEALNSPSVRHATTRDDLDTFRKYFDLNPEKLAGLCTDPAVFTPQVFGVKKAPGASTIGISVVRGRLFKTNEKPWTESDEMDFVCGLIDVLESRGADYVLLSNGLHTDEIFMRHIAMHRGIPEARLILDINDSDTLINIIANLKGLIAFRLHANIIASSLGVPSVGLEWNEKVRFFFSSVGRAERSIAFPDWNPEATLAAFDRALNEGIALESDYLLNAYIPLRQGLMTVLGESAAISNSGGEKIKHIDELLIALTRTAQSVPPESALIQHKNKIRSIESSYLKLESNELAKRKLLKSRIESLEALIAPLESKKKHHEKLIGALRAKNAGLKERSKQQAIRLASAKDRITSLQQRLAAATGVLSKIRKQGLYRFLKKLRLFKY